VATALTDETSVDALRARVAALEAALAAGQAQLVAERQRTEALVLERDRLRAAYTRLQEELELLRRRIFVAKAERVDAGQLELEFAAKRAELADLVARLGAAAATDTEDDDEAGDPPASRDPAKRKRPTGRRDVRSAPIPEERVELIDPTLEGTAERIGFEESCRVAWRRGGLVRIVLARAKYQVLGDDQETSVETTPMPPETFPRSMADASLLAKILTSKFHFGMPFFRQEEELAACGFGIDRGTMCRWAEDVGMTLGATIVEAMRGDAFTAFCIATDATGVCVQPEPSPTKGRQACRRGHFFTLLADCDHVLFEYMPRETSQAVAAMFKGYSGYIQADAKSVYDVLFRDPGAADDVDDARSEVGCWAHARRKFYEAAITKQRAAREALYRIREVFELERTWSGVPPARRKILRLQHTKPRLDDFFAWAEVEYRKVEGERGLVRSAFGYVVRQKAALMRFLEDGRLRVDNNASERALRQIAVGRKAWLFVGSDDHAEAAANIFSVVASCKFHRLDPEAYLRDVLRVLAQWPRDRYLELAPKSWAATRARLDPAQLAAPVGWLTVPPPPAKEQVTTG
jgi:transposase